MLKLRNPPITNDVTHIKKITFATILNIAFVYRLKAAIPVQRGLGFKMRIAVTFSANIEHSFRSYHLCYS